ncbi:hypothetical protein V6N12_042908 [Hibiscus sabdariffa]|uniref:RNase H type-1 domain-containing protein n=1 Tax=Hibiscus sabdariffa TaxID=183260 RepID=A0ABR2BG45_9ROSI
MCSMKFCIAGVAKSQMVGCGGVLISEAGVLKDMFTGTAVIPSIEMAAWLANEGVLRIFLKLGGESLGVVGIDFSYSAQVLHTAVGGFELTSSTTAYGGDDADLKGVKKSVN